MNEDVNTSYQNLLKVVNAIPRGRVISYGNVGAIIGISGWSVGRLLSNLSEEQWDKVMWHRVVAKNGQISSLKLGIRGQLQIQLLQKENIKTSDGVVNMKEFEVTKDELDELSGIIKN